MENPADSNFVFGLVALTAIVLAITAWVYLSATGDESLPAESPPITTTAPS